MKYRKIGRTSIEVSEISLGCWTLGGDADAGGMGWKAPSDTDAVEAVKHGLERGVNHFDNADVYGMGRAERVLAKALGDDNKRVVIASKVGWYKGESEHAYRKENILKQCVQSLKNLNRDYLDIYYFHNCDFGESDKYLDEGLEAFRALKKEGKIRSIGLSGYAEADFLRLIPRIEPDCLQSWANILHPEFIKAGSPVASMLKERGITFTAFNPLSRGLLTGKFSPKNPPVLDKNDVRSTMEEFKPAYLAGFYGKLERIKERFGSRPEKLIRAALQYILSHEVVSCVIPGFRNKKQVEQNTTMAESPLSAEEVEFIETVFRD
ncbi:MAG TPA: aldo/keto reductase [bacterium]|nr:aldo/keto reductase [bacterium]